MKDCLFELKKSSESFLNEEGVCSRLYISNDIHDPDQRRRNTIRFYFLIRYSGPPAIPNLNPRRLRSVSVVLYIYIFKCYASSFHFGFQPSFQPSSKNTKFSSISSYIYNYNNLNPPTWMGRVQVVVVVVFSNCLFLFPIKDPKCPVEFCYRTLDCHTPPMTRDDDENRHQQAPLYYNRVEQLLVLDIMHMPWVPFRVIMTSSKIRKAYTILVLLLLGVASRSYT